MITPLKTVRVFISSTFRDMHAERDHLVTVVFPELRERVEQLGLEFFDVDLRWGVPAKDANGETANSWEYCRQWIDRVEPFFVCILGQRYGWVPEPEQLKSTEDRQRQQDEQRSITDLEVRHAVLNSKRKRRSYFYLRATEAPATASEYVDPPLSLGKLEQLKQAVRVCGRPVRNYSPEWTGQGFVGLKEFGDFVLEDLWSGILRDERYKEIWRQVLKADPESDPRYTDESQPVPDNIAKQLVELAKPKPKDPLEAEREQMATFAQARLRWFQGRTKELEQLTDFINSTDEPAPRLAAVVAVPGQGKSALLAKLSTINSQLSTFQITHFVGATEHSASAHALVQRLLDELDRSGITWPADERKEGEEPKRDFNSLCHRLAQRLGDYAGERRIVILLDALNQLSDGHDLHWLPTKLGSGVRVIVSCVVDSAEKGGKQKTEIDQSLLTSAATADSPEQRVLQALDHRKARLLRIPLGALEEADVRTIVVAYLKEYCHELDGEHLDTLCAITQARNPLYLQVMLNELRTLGGNDLNTLVPALIAAMPQKHPDTVSLFRWVLQRLEVFGAEAVRWWCLYLAHGRVGMASHELADLLARKLGADAAATALRIERGLRRYLQRRGGQLDFFHGQLRQAVMEQFGPQIASTTVHHELADYFTACAKGTAVEWETDSVRGFAECVFQFIRAGQHEQAAGLLGNFPFLLHKLRVGLLEGVLEDYAMFRGEATAGLVKQMEIWADFFREKAHIFRRGNEEWPAHKILLQLAVEHADDSPLTIGAESWLAEGRCDWLWLRRNRRLPHAQANPCVFVLEGHTDSVRGALILPDGQILSWGGGPTILRRSEDQTLRLWDAKTGKCLTVLEGHSCSVKGVLPLTDDRLLSWDECAPTALRLWDQHRGKCLALLIGHQMWIHGALVLPDGRLLSWSYDQVMLWDAKTGKCLGVHVGQTGRIRGAMVLADGSILSWSDDKCLRVWDADSGSRLTVLEGHTDRIRGALKLSDDHVLSWSDDRTLRLWDVQIGKCFTVLEGHSGQVNGALALKGGHILSWSNDNILRLWDNQNGKCLAVLEGPPIGIEGVLELSDGRILSWSGGKTLRLWDVQSSKCFAVLEGHEDQIGGALALGDSRILSWSDDKTLRLWNTQNGDSLAVIEGHSQGAIGALTLSDSRILSWSGDKDLRLWDVHSGKCLTVLEGHSGPINGALALANGKILSWSDDKTLRLWDTQNCKCLTVLEGHAKRIKGALALNEGRALSLSSDRLLYWDVQTGKCLSSHTEFSYAIGGAHILDDGRVLSWGADEGLIEGKIGSHGLRLLDVFSSKSVHSGTWCGHRETILGALPLTDACILSWSCDKTLRIWDSSTLECRTVLEGHTDWVTGALELTEQRILSWSRDNSLRLWNAQTGKCFEVISEDEVATIHPEWLHARAKTVGVKNVWVDFFAASTQHSVHLRHKTRLSSLASWNTDSVLAAHCLLPDGTAVVTQRNGQVCMPKLHHGHRRISFAEAEAILTERKKAE